LLGIADRFNVDSEDVRKWNRLKSNHVGRGMVLRIYTIGAAPQVVPAHAASKRKKRPAPAASSRTASGSASNQPN